MRKILILTGRYLPGYRDGGPVRSIVNLTEWLGDEYDIRIMCLDRDHGDVTAYPDIKTGEFNIVGKAKVWYTPAFAGEDIEKLAKDADVVYCCGPYNDYARLAMRLKKEDRIKAPLYVASMGSFSPEAFKIKGFKKRLYVTYMKLTGMFGNVTWSVTSVREEQELKKIIGSKARCVIASDLPRQGPSEHKHIKEKDGLKLCFVSRISRKKNLMAIPEILDKIDEKYSISLDVYGTDEDAGYLGECTRKLDSLVSEHANIAWEYKGEADSEKIPEIFAGYDAFLFPTLGENYGHVIAESLAAGCIPVISDTTPWLNLDEKGCGYVCRLGDNDAFRKALTVLASMTQDELKARQDKCYEYILAVNAASVEDSGYRVIFNSR